METRLIKPEEKKEFDEVDKKLDSIAEQRKNEFKHKTKEGSVKLKHKIYMTISDVDPEDAREFKEWCDKHTDGKQFLGIKVLMQIMKRIDPIYENIVNQVNSLHTRVENLETTLLSSTMIEEDEGYKIPKTQGGNKK